MRHHRRNNNPTDLEKINQDAYEKYIVRKMKGYLVLLIGGSLILLILFLLFGKWENSTCKHRQASQASVCKVLVCDSFKCCAKWNTLRNTSCEGSSWVRYHKLQFGKGTAIRSAAHIIFRPQNKGHAKGRGPHSPALCHALCLRTFDLFLFLALRAAWTNSLQIMCSHILPLA